MLEMKNRAYEDRLFPYILLYLASLNIFECGSAMWLLYTLMSFAGFVIFSREKPVFDLSMLFCLVASVGAAVASLIYYEPTDAIKAALMFLSCLAGCVNYSKAHNKSRYIFITVSVIFFAYLSQVLLLYVYNLCIERESDRVLMSLWKDGRISVTAVGLLCAIIIGYAGYLIFCSNRARGKISGALCLTLVCSVNMMTATRTPFVIIAIVLFVGLAYTLMSSGRAWHIMQILGASLFIFLIVWYADAFGIKTIIEESPVYERFIKEGLQTSRMQTAVGHFSQMLDYPWGGKNISLRYGEAHNLLQESYDMYGVLVFSSLAALTAGFVIRFLRLMVAAIREDGTAGLLLFVYAAVIPQFFVEPIFSSYPLILWGFIMINTLASLYLRESKLCEKGTLAYE